MTIAIGDFVGFRFFMMNGLRSVTNFVKDILYDMVEGTHSESFQL